MSTKPIDTRISKQRWDETFLDRANSADVWIYSSLKLLVAADLLWDESEKWFEYVKDLPVGSEQSIRISNQISMMLYGLSVENAFKAVQVSIHGGLDKKGNFALKSHALLSIAAKEKIPLEVGDESLLFRLQRFIEWAGKYPIPLNANELRPKILNNGSSEYGSSVKSTDKLDVHQLIDRILLLLKFKRSDFGVQ